MKDKTVTLLAHSNLQVSPLQSQTELSGTSTGAPSISYLLAATSFFSLTTKLNQTVIGISWQNLGHHMTRINDYVAGENKCCRF